MVNLVIFDMDGLMLDNEAVARDIWVSVCPDQPEQKSEDIFLETIGWSRSNIISTLNARYPELDAKKTYRRFEDALADQSRRLGIPLKPGLLELLDYLDNKSILKCVATSTSRASAENTLKEKELYHRFDGHVYGDMVVNSKPAPDLFQLAANTFDIPPNCCVVLEDSPSGIRAAYAADMIPIMIPDLLRPDAEICSILHSKCESLHEVAFVLEALL